MGQEYLRIQIYFPKGEAILYRAIEALARKDGVSMAEVARRAIKEYLDTEEVMDKVLGAASEAVAMDHIRSKDPCRHRSINQNGTINCTFLGPGKEPSVCMECEKYEPK